MGLFSHRLLLRLTASAAPGGKQDLKIDKIEDKITHLLPFSCISLVGSQFLTLTSDHPRALANTLLAFIENPEAVYQDTGIVNGFELEIYRNNDKLLYNKFNPIVSADHPSPDLDRLQAGIVRTLSNYVLTVYDGSSEQDKIHLQFFLLVLIECYQQDLIPKLSKKVKQKIKHRKNLAKSHLDFINTMFHLWKNQVALMPGSAPFLEKLNEAKNFDSYLP